MYDVPTSIESTIPSFKTVSTSSCPNNGINPQINAHSQTSLSVFHTIIHNQHNQAQSCTIAQSHNQNTNFQTITQSKFKFCKFYYVMITIIHNHTQSICKVIFQALYSYLLLIQYKLIKSEWPSIVAMHMPQYNVTMRWYYL